MKILLLIAGFFLIIMPASADTISGKVTSINMEDSSITVSTGKETDFKVLLKGYLESGGNADFLDIGLDVEVQGKPNSAGGIDAVKLKKKTAEQEEPMPMASENRRVKYSDDEVLKNEAAHATDLSEILPTNQE